MTQIEDPPSQASPVPVGGEKYHPIGNSPAWSTTEHFEPAFDWYNSQLEFTFHSPPLQPLSKSAISGVHARWIEHIDAETIILVFPAFTSKAIFDVVYRAMMNNILQRRYLGVVAGKETRYAIDQQPTLPWIIPPEQARCVLGFFCPVAMWNTVSSGEDRSTYRTRVFLQKLDLTKQSWWAKDEYTPTPLHLRQPGIPLSTVHCDRCGFFCLQPSCSKSRIVVRTYFPPHPAPAKGVDLSMLLRTRTNHVYMPPEYTPGISLPLLIPSWRVIHDAICWEAATSPETLQQLLAITALLIKGFVCPQCGMINSRIFWKGW